MVTFNADEDQSNYTNVLNGFKSFPENVARIEKILASGNPAAVVLGDGWAAGNWGKAIAECKDESELLRRIDKWVECNGMPLPRNDSGNEVMAVLFWNKKSLLEHPVRAFTIEKVAEGGSVNIGGLRIKIC